MLEETLFLDLVLKFKIFFKLFKERGFAIAEPLFLSK